MSVPEYHSSVNVLKANMVPLDMNLKQTIPYLMNLVWEMIFLFLNSKEV